MKENVDFYLASFNLFKLLTSNASNWWIEKDTISKICVRPLGKWRPLLKVLSVNIHVADFLRSMLLFIGSVPWAFPIWFWYLSCGASAVHGESNISERVSHFSDLVLLNQGTVEFACISDFHLSEVIIVIDDFLIL